MPVFSRRRLLFIVVIEVAVIFLLVGVAATIAYPWDLDPPRNDAVRALLAVVPDGLRARLRASPLSAASMCDDCFPDPPQLHRGAIPGVKIVEIRPGPSEARIATPVGDFWGRRDDEKLLRFLLLE